MIPTMKYPRCIFFIVASTFCERFSFFGVKILLPLYFIDILRYDENTATIVHHALQMFTNFFPLVSAMIADSWLGKYRAILYLTVMYAFGKVLIFVAAMPMLNLPITEISLVSLFLIGIGSGGIRPCVSAFGGDQFQLPQQAAYLAAFFSIFYVAANSGALVSMILTPILRKDFTCYGYNTCYPLAFSISAVFMVAALVIFFAGKRFYTIKKPEENITWKVTTCISHAVSRKIRSKEKQKHWLDYAADKYDKNLIEDIKSTLKVLKLFIPLPIFWTLFDLQGSRWLFQTIRTNGEVFGYLIKPDQFQVVNAIAVVLLVPLYQYAIYPVIEKFFFINTPLRKMTVGGLLASLAFAISGIFELVLEPTYAIKPSSGLAQVRIFNAIDCDATLYLDENRYLLRALDVYQNLSIPVIANSTIDFRAEFENCTRSNTPNYTFKKLLQIEEAKATSWILTSRGISSAVSDLMEKSKSGDPKLRVLMSLGSKLTDASLILESHRDSYTINTTSNTQFTDFIEVNHNSYRLTYNGEEIAKNMYLRFGGVYTMVGYISDNHRSIKLTTQVEPNSIHMFWLIPQYVIMTMGEVMFAVTGIEFAYSQAPDSMKSLLQAAWHLTTALGNLIIVIIANAKIFDRQVFEFFLFAGLMLIDMIIFAAMAKFYKYVDFVSVNNSHDDCKPTEEKQAIE